MSLETVTLNDFVGTYDEDTVSSMSLAPILARLGISQKKIDATLAAKTTQTISIQDENKLLMAYSSTLGQTTDRHIVNAGPKTLKFKDDDSTTTITECQFIPNAEYPLKVTTILPAGKGTMVDQRRLIDSGIEQLLCHQSGSDPNNKMIIKRIWIRNSSTKSNQPLSSSTSNIPKPVQGDNNKKQGEKSISQSPTPSSITTSAEITLAKDIKTKFNGEWMVDESRSEAIEPLLVDLGLKKKASKTTAGSKITHEIIIDDEDDTLTLVNRSDVGDFNVVHKINEHARVLTNARGEMVKTSCTFDASAEFQFIIKSISHDNRGSTIDMRKINHDGTEMVQRLIFTLSGSTGKKEISADRIWIRPTNNPAHIKKVESTLLQVQPTSTPAQMQQISTPITPKQESLQKLPPKQNQISTEIPAPVHVPLLNQAKEVKSIETTEKNSQTSSTEGLTEKVDDATLFIKKQMIENPWFGVMASMIFITTFHEMLLFDMKFSDILKATHHIGDSSFDYILLLLLSLSVIAFIHFRIAARNSINQSSEILTRKWPTVDKWIFLIITLFGITFLNNDWVLCLILAFTYFSVRRQTPNGKNQTDLFVLDLLNDQNHIYWIFVSIFLILLTISIFIDHESFIPTTFCLLYMRYRAYEGKIENCDDDESEILNNINNEKTQKNPKLDAKIESINVKEFRVTENQFAEYLISTKLIGIKEGIEVWRRYSTFRLLRRTLGKKNEYHLPPKRLFFNLAVDVLELRRHSFDEFIQDLLQDPDITDHSEFRAFLGL